MTSPDAGQPHRQLSDLARPARRALVMGGYTTLEQLPQVTEADLARTHAIGARLSIISSARPLAAAGGLRIPPLELSPSSLHGSICLTKRACHYHPADHAQVSRYHGDYLQMRELVRDISAHREYARKPG